LAFLALAATAPASAAQDRADFTGMWQLSIEESQFGMARAPNSGELEMSRADSRLVMSTFRDFGNDMTRESSLDIPIDGERHDTETEAGAGLASAEWDGGELVLWRLTEAHVRMGAETEVIEIEVTERVSLGDSGQLHIARTIVFPQRAPMTQTLVYQRAGS
jgi:hypothetical protein